MASTTRSLHRRASFQACHAARPSSRIGTTVTRPVMIRSSVSLLLGLTAVAGRPRIRDPGEAPLTPAAVGSRWSDINSASRASDEGGPNEEQHGAPHEEKPRLLGAMRDGGQPEEQADSAAPNADLGAVRRVHGHIDPSRSGYSAFNGRKLSSSSGR